MTIIAAIDENRAIGHENKLLWHLPDDLKRFKKLTLNHTIIMGRKTFESLGKPLPNRTHIVITSNPDYSAPEGVLVTNSVEEAFKLAIEKDDHPFIIGGGEIYKQAINLVSYLELTLVHTKIEKADTYFPSIDLTKWKKTNEEHHSKDDKHLYDFSFITYSKI